MADERDWHCRIGRVKRRGNVYAFRGTVSPELGRDEQPVAGVIAELEQLLADAKSGKIRAIAFALVFTGNFTSYGWARGHGQTAHAQAAAIGDLSFAIQYERYVAHMDYALPNDPGPK
jgi:hypothetical protein